jgi:hypothetical protein
MKQIVLLAIAAFMLSLAGCASSGPSVEEQKAKEAAKSKKAADEATQELNQEIQK